MARTTSRVEGDTLVLVANSASPIMVGTPAWFAWLDGATSFVFNGPAGRFTARKEKRSRGGWYWKAYYTAHGALLCWPFGSSGVAMPGGARNPRLDDQQQSHKTSVPTLHGELE